jgi:hypothetical protein
LLILHDKLYVDVLLLFTVVVEVRVEVLREGVALSRDRLRRVLRGRHEERRACCWVEVRDLLCKCLWLTYLLG